MMNVAQMFGMRCSRHKKMNHEYNCALNNVGKIAKWYFTYCKKQKP